MRLLVFDTETTGLPKFRSPAIEGANNWPHIVSISWIVLETDTNTEITRKNFLVKPRNWIIPPESTAVHGITHAHAMEHGLDLEYVLHTFLNEPCDAWVAHNLEFDMNVVIHGYIWDLRHVHTPIPARKYCTMKLGRIVCGVDKYPKLTELYAYTFGCPPPNPSMLHTSMYDVEILVDILRTSYALRDRMFGLRATNVLSPYAVHKGNVLHIT
uniref:Exonuclease domain-containing protein n=1 Tax=viral metagenome TaxID=1070528 RepID=A0A6C0JVI3_9ZZZZ